MLIKTVGNVKTASEMKNIFADSKKRMSWLCGALFAVSALSTLAEAGSELSGGLDRYTMANALYRSANPDRKIETCVEVAPDFGLSNVQAQAMVRESFSQWGRYIEQKDLHYAVWTGSPGIVTRLSDHIADRCRGDEELRIYLGVINSEIALRLSNHDQPFGFAEPATTVSTPRDLPHGADRFTKGILWIAPNGSVQSECQIPTWRIQDHRALRATLLHEVGHLLGNNHVDGTIMSSRIADFLQSWTTGSDNYLTCHRYPMNENYSQIDQDAELVQNLNLAANFELKREYGHVGHHYPDHQALHSAFTRVAGRAPVGEYSAQWQRFYNSNRIEHQRPERIFSNSGDAVLTLTDSRGTQQFRFVSHALVATKDDSAPQFNGQHGNHYRSFAASFFGTLESKTPAGTLIKLPVVVNYGMSFQRLQVILVDADSNEARGPIVTQNATDYPLFEAL